MRVLATINQMKTVFLYRVFLKVLIVQKNTCVEFLELLIAEKRA